MIPADSQGTTQAVILAAGEGQRMLPLSKAHLKGMLSVANKPIIEYIIIEAQKAGIHDFILVTNPKDNAIPHYFGDGTKFGIRISYRHQEKVDGTGAALRTVQDIVRQNFLLFNSDMLISAADILQLLHAESITVGVKEKNNTGGFGIIEAQDSRIRRVVEKPAVASSLLVNTGAYLLNKHIFAAIENTPLSPRGEIELTQALQILIDQGTAVYCTHLESWYDISYPWDLLSANAHLLSQLDSDNQGVIEKNVHIDGVCRIGSGSIVRSGSYIAGPVIIGDNCDIGPNCYIRSASSIGNNCRVGNGVEIKNSIIMQGSKIPHMNYVGDSIIGENCNLGAGTNIANIRFDKKDIAVNGFDTNLKKFGAILGDEVQTGINVSINAGTIIGNRVRVWPGVVAHGNIPDDTQMKKTNTISATILEKAIDITVCVD